MLADRPNDDHDDHNRDDHNNHTGDHPDYYDEDDIPIKKRRVGRHVRPRSRRQGPPRPCNAFVLWRSAKCKRMKTSGNWTPQHNLSKILGNEWLTLSEEQRAYWVLKAQEEKEKHKLKYPDYVFRPRPKGYKKQKKEEALKASTADNAIPSPSNSASTSQSSQPSEGPSRRPQSGPVRRRAARQTRSDSRRAVPPYAYAAALPLDSTPTSAPHSYSALEEPQFTSWQPMNESLPLSEFPMYRNNGDWNFGTDVPPAPDPSCFLSESPEGSAFSSLPAYTPSTSDAFSTVDGASSVDNFFTMGDFSTTAGPSTFADYPAVGYPGWNDDGWSAAPPMSMAMADPNYNANHIPLHSVHDVHSSWTSASDANHGAPGPYGSSSNELSQELGFYDNQPLAFAGANGFLGSTTHSIAGSLSNSSSTGYFDSNIDFGNVDVGYSSVGTLPQPSMRQMGSSSEIPQLAFSGAEVDPGVWSRMFDEESGLGNASMPTTGFGSGSSSSTGYGSGEVSSSASDSSIWDPLGMVPAQYESGEGDEYLPHEL